MASIGHPTKVSNVGEGDQILSPLSGDKLLVRRVESAPLGMLDFLCRDIYGDGVTLTLNADEDVRVLNDLDEA